MDVEMKIETDTEFYGGGEHPEHLYTTLYRYRLQRIWNEQENPLLVIGCNPSTATAEELDETMRQVIKIARNNEYGGVIMCNLYAYRGTRPDDMKNAARNISQNNQDGFAYVIGPHNEAQLVEAAALVEDVVFAYGNIAVEGWTNVQGMMDNVIVSGNFYARAYKDRVIQLMRQLGKNLFAFETTAAGNPMHPLPHDAELKNQIRNSEMDEWKIW